MRETEVSEIYCVTTQEALDISIAAGVKYQLPRISRQPFEADTVTLAY